ncbi:MAG: cell cycle histidine kinase CckA [Rhizobiaceae bacterium]
MNKPEKPRLDKPTAAKEANPGPQVTNLFLLGLGLAVLSATLFLFGNEWLGEPFMLAILGAMAACGVFFTFLVILGFVQVTSRKRVNALAQGLVDDMDAGLIVIDSDGRIVYSNQAYAELTGATDETEIASVEKVFSRRSEASELIYRMSNNAKKGLSTVEEFRLANGLRTGDEGARWFRMRARPLDLGGTGGPMTVWQVSDITQDRSRQENAFLELQNAINYLDHAPAGFLSSEAGGAVVYINATLADWLGIDLAQFVPGSLKMDEIVLGDGMALLDAVKANNDGSRTAVIELDLAKTDGRPLPVRLYHRVAADTDGAPGATRTVVLNRMEQESKWDDDAEINFTRFFNSTPMAIAAVGKDGSIRRTNAPFQRMFGNLVESKGGIKSLKFSDLAEDENRDALKSAMKAALAGQAKIAPVDVSVPGEDELSARIYVSPVSVDDDTGKAESDENQVLIHVLDMTEQRALEEQFAQGQKMQAVGQLAGGVAHDFNNVLTAIIGFSDLLLANHRPSDPSFQDIMNIKQNANRAASLVRQLLAFSRRQTLRPQILQLGDVLSDLRMLLGRLLGETVELEVKHGRDLWPVKVDLSQFEQVIVNLAVNARDAMPDGGKLSIRTSNFPEENFEEDLNFKGMPPGDYVLIEVEDGGTGISEKVLEKIFEPFFSTKEVGKGTGLGLSTVYGIIKQTGGFIYPESEVGKGTLFRVFLPRHDHEEEVADASNEVEEGNEEDQDKKRDLTGNATLLLVEDEDAVRAFAMRALMSRGYTVHEASSGVEALEVIEDEGPIFDLVISDVVMPEMDGPTLFTELRSQHPDLKFIFMSGYAEEAFAKNLPDPESQQFGFLPKPFSLKQLATTVKEVLES